MPSFSKNELATYSFSILIQKMKGKKAYSQQQQNFECFSFLALI